MNARRVALLACGFLVWRIGWCGDATRKRSPARPDILVIMADDCTYSDLPVYGGRNARAPHIDRLASEGMTFNKSYLSVAMCQPCRAALYTGQYPMRVRVGSGVG